MKKIKIGQIGVCHEHASGKIGALRKLPDVYEIVGVVDDRDTAAARFAGDNLAPYEGLTWMTEEELFATPGLQAVAVETPNLDLVPTALRCMERGLHMHMDKPAGDDMALFEKLLDGCREKGLALQLGYMLRTNPPMMLCEQAVREGWLGDILQIQVDMNHNYGGEAYPDYMGSFTGGIMFNLGCHPIDWIVSLLGRPDNVTPFPKAVPGIDSCININGLAIIEYPHTHVTVRVCSATAESTGQRRLTVCGTKGTFDLCPLEKYDGKPMAARLTLAEGNGQYDAGTHTVEFEGVSDRYMAQMQELAHVINGEIENPYSYDHDRLAHDVILAASGYTRWDAGNGA
ncbi:MAG: Gfo/Idh/MocA family oxidoreductase [Lentisphaerae bacterium]|jgi:predicted dehydrogenase|nr:Gfo/Idh/MocA family oxidoreductase [Lentisphaerota bacterium]MBT4817235.1 Gfo/Idh/MocA family oxidoreductase [Lentisphaerota bacterium]MBT5608324.1 Gfo/Idh/MocA family oxidoreductase [Lentisphaerota bacterium]MBT7057481.1 Gfo/Idh/MocA family oxidoreductase [Lentisphaerota bacterium]MBT7844481.1 Gfo/Idh/MocA family oxidoreductase [Lentisphaerota bacterium]